MSDQNMTRRDAVKLGGTALAAVGLAAGAQAAIPAEPSSVPGTDYPDFRGKVVLLYTTDKHGSCLLADAVVTMLGGRPFLTGTMPAKGFWTDNLTAAVACDVVKDYLVFDSLEDYTARVEMHKRWKEAQGKSDAGGLGD
jgi:hypothetical protein